MTPRERELLDFIDAYMAAHRIPPNFVEMCVGIGAASKSSIDRLLTSLEGQGEIQRPFGKTRGLVRTSPDRLQHFSTEALMDELRRRRLEGAEA